MSQFNRFRKSWLKALASIALALSFTACEQAHAQPLPSGLLLGANVYPTAGGLRVISTIPGSPAQGHLLPGDVLTRGGDGTWIYSIGTVPVTRFMVLQQIRSIRAASSR